METRGQIVRTFWATVSLDVDTHQNTENVDHTGVGAEQTLSKFWVLLTELKGLNPSWVSEVLGRARVCCKFSDEVGISEHFGDPEALRSIVGS